MLAEVVGWLRGIGWNSRSRLASRRPRNVRCAETLESRQLPAIITVTTLRDLVSDTDGKTSLREAITQANATVEADEIVLPAGTYGISRSGRNEDVNRTGDFDIVGSLTIRGAGVSRTVIDGRRLDRVFQVHGTETLVAQVVLEDLTIRGGLTRSGFVGAGILVEGDSDAFSSLSLVHVALKQNKSGGDGGALAIQNAMAVIDQSEISGNTAHRDGGGVWSPDGGLMLMDSTVSGNLAHRNGGGLASGDVILVNATLSGNRAFQAGGGLFATRSLAAEHVTVTANHAGRGGGIFSKAPAAELRNSIVAQNRAITAARGHDVNGVFTSLGHNLIGSRDGAAESFPAANAIGDLVGTSLRRLNPRLGSLGHNGGPTKTHKLLTNSPAIDAATNRDSLVTDQRGLPRGVDGNRDRVSVSDIGAFELILEGWSESTRLGSPTLTYRQLHQDVLINADYWELQPRILGAGLGFTDILGLPGLLSTNVSVQEAAVRRAGGGWNDVNVPDQSSVDVRARASAASPAAVAISYGWPVLFSDGFPIEFSWPVRPSTVDATDFVVTLNTGERVQPQVASVFPNFEYNERSTVVIFGSFGNRLPPQHAGAVYPVRLEIAADDTPLELIGPAGIVQSAVGFSFGDGSTPMTAYQANSGPTLVAAKLSRMSVAGEGGPDFFNGNMPNDGVALYGDQAQYRLRVVTTGGFSPDGVRSLFPTEFARYFQVRAVTQTGEERWLTQTNVAYEINGGSLTILGLAELGLRQDQYDDAYVEDHDNQIDIILSGDESAIRAITHVFIPGSGNYTPFLNPGGPGNDPSPGVIYTQPGPPTLQPVTLALDDPWTVTLMPG